MFDIIDVMKRQRLIMNRVIKTHSERERSETAVSVFFFFFFFFFGGLVFVERSLRKRGKIDIAVSSHIGVDLDGLVRL